jgi:hypothetical protein
VDREIKHYMSPGGNSRPPTDRLIELSGVFAACRPEPSAGARVEARFPHYGNAKLAAAERVYIVSGIHLIGSLTARCQMKCCCFDALQNCHMYKN